jgi:hypothetical protein
VIFEDASGDLNALPIGSLGGSSGWQPSVQMPIVVNLLPLLPDSYTPVAFRFTTQGSGEFQIDDVYVDPMRH